MDLDDLYQEVVIDHNRNPRNFKNMEDADRHVEGYNPLCGDRITIYLKMQGDRIEDVSFDGQGCAISIASASLMTEAMKGKTMEQADKLFRTFHDMLAADGKGRFDGKEADKLLALAGVRDYPTRIKCATLSWHTLRSALHHDKQQVTTE